MSGTTPSAQTKFSQKFNHPFKGCSRIGQYEVLGKLGEGTFGEVHRARSRRTGTVVALKKILMHNEKDGFPVTAIREIKILKMLSHVNILHLEEMAVERSKAKEKKKAIMYMVTPYMEHDLSGLLTNPNVRFTEPQIKCYMLQLLEGVRFLHDSHTLHRDMKAANLLINNRGILQIADFGLARHYEEPVPQKGRGGGEARRDYTALVVTRWYRPPELLLSLRRYTTAIDLWGVGCVFGEMFKRSPIFQGGTDLGQLELIFDAVGGPTEENMPGWSSLPGCDGVKEFRPSESKLAQKFRELHPQALSLLRSLLRLDWRRRATALDALSHPYFTTEPLPLRPEDIPHFEDSHELDHRRNKGGHHHALPPAPAGGTVGMGPNGEWGAPATHQNFSNQNTVSAGSSVRTNGAVGVGGGGFGSRPPSRTGDRRDNRHHPYDRDRERDRERERDRDRYPPDRAYDNPRHAPQGQQRSPNKRPAWERAGERQRDHDRDRERERAVNNIDNHTPTGSTLGLAPGGGGGTRHALPPRPPRSMDANGNSHRAPPREPGRGGASGGGGVDTYIPSYSDGGVSRKPPPRDERDYRERDRDNYRGDRDRDRDRNRREPRDAARDTRDARERRPPGPPGERTDRDRDRDGRERDKIQTSRALTKSRSRSRSPQRQAIDGRRDGDVFSRR